MSKQPDTSAIVAICQRTIESLNMVILFGSCNSATASSTSDLDIAVSANRVLSAEQKMALIDQLSALTGRAIDLIDLSKVGEPLLNQILTTGTRLYGSNRRYAELMMRNVIANEDFVPLQRRLIKERLDAWIRS